MAYSRTDAFSRPGREMFEKTKKENVKDYSNKPKKKKTGLTDEVVDSKTGMLWSN